MIRLAILSLTCAILIQSIETKQCRNYVKYWPCKCHYLNKDPKKMVLDCQNEDIQKIYNVFDKVTPLDSADIEEVSIRSEAKHLRKRLVGNATPKKLWVSVKGLESVSEDLLAGLENSLDFVSVDKTNMNHIPAEAFKKLKKLETFEFKNSKDVESVGANSFAGFAGSNALKRIVLTNNNIKQLGEGAFSGLPQLEEVDLDGNKVEEIGLKNFSPSLEKMKFIFLASNKLKSVPFGPKFVEALPSRTFVGLANNDLKTVSGDLLRAFIKRNSFVRLEGNKLNCDCSFTTVASANENYVKGNFVGKCWNPERLRGRLLQYLLYRNFPSTCVVDRRDIAAIEKNLEIAAY